MGVQFNRPKVYRNKMLTLFFVCFPICIMLTVTFYIKHPILTEQIRQTTTSKEFGTDNLSELQWWIKNNGSFSSFSDSPTAWGVEKRYALTGIDLNIGEEVFNRNQKRPLLIAVIDTGVDIHHPALAKGIYKNQNEIQGDGIDNDKNGFVDDYMGWDFYDNDNSIYCLLKQDMVHGTASVGLIIGSDQATGYTSILSGFDVQVLCIRVLGGESSAGNLDSILRAISYAKSFDAKICAFSINTVIESELMKSEISKSGMLFVVSAGNNCTDLDKYSIDYPTCFSLNNVISVANLRCDGHLSNTSNYGCKQVDIAAPGTNILCAATGGGYEFFSGTSLSVSAVVSEAALLYIKSNKVLNAHEIKEVILKSATPLKAIQNQVRANGIPNFEMALMNSIAE